MRLVEAELDKEAFKCTAAAEPMTLREARQRHIDEDSRGTTPWGG